MSKTTAKLTEGSSLPLSTLDALYEIRAAQVHLKNSVSLERDRAIFEDTMRDSTHVCLLTSLGREVGFVCADLRHITDPQDAWVMRFIYAFIEPEHRGGRAYIHLFLRDIASRLLRRPLASLYYYGVAFPPSFVRTSSYASELITLDGSPQDPRVTLLSHLTSVYEGERLCQERGTVWMPTIPVERERVWSRRVDRDAASRYDRLNPAWREGRSLPILVPVGFKTLLLTLRRSL